MLPLLGSLTDKGAKNEVILISQISLFGFLCILVATSLCRKHNSGRCYCPIKSSDENAYRERMKRDLLEELAVDK